MRRRARPCPPAHRVPARRVGVENGELPQGSLVAAAAQRVPRHTHPHRNHLWSPSYFAASCGGAPLETIKTYIQSQQTPAPLTPPAKTGLARRDDGQQRPPRCGRRRGHARCVTAASLSPLSREASLAAISAHRPRPVSRPKAKRAVVPLTPAAAATDTKVRPGFARTARTARQRATSKESLPSTPTPYPQPVERIGTKRRLRDSETSRTRTLRVCG